MTEPYARLWALIDGSMPDPERFAAKVAELDAQQLVELYADVIDASAEVREKWEGPYIPDFDGHLSVLVRACRLGEVSYQELKEIIEDAWLSRASRRRREDWLNAQKAR